MAKTKTVGDLLKLLEGLDPNIELWEQDVRDDNECLPIVNLPKVSTIVRTTHQYESGGTKKLWVVNDPDFLRVEEEDIEDSKTALIWNS